jgi:hypothetical protein
VKIYLDDMTKFIPGQKLCEQFYKEVVKVLIETEFYELRYSAGLIDYGSEVLGFDTERSTDHDWGPRILLFLSAKDICFSQQKPAPNILRLFNLFQ